MVGKEPISLSLLHFFFFLFQCPWLLLEHILVHFSLKITIKPQIWGLRFSFDSYLSHLLFVAMQRYKNSNGSNIYDEVPGLKGMVQLQFQNFWVL